MMKHGHRKQDFVPNTERENVFVQRNMMISDRILERGGTCRKLIHREVAGGLTVKVPNLEVERLILDNGPIALGLVAQFLANCQAPITLRVVVVASRLVAATRHRFHIQSRLQYRLSSCPWPDSLN